MFDKVVQNLILHILVYTNSTFDKDLNISISKVNYESKVTEIYITHF